MNLLEIGRSALPLAEKSSCSANVGGTSIEAANARGMRQMFRESKVAQESGRVNAMGLRWACGIVQKGQKCVNQCEL
jgi:hypothetical protein